MAVECNGNLQNFVMHKFPQIRTSWMECIFFVGCLIVLVAAVVAFWLWSTQDGYEEAWIEENKDGSQGVCVVCSGHQWWCVENFFCH